MKMAPSSLPAGRQVAWPRIMEYFVYILKNRQGRHYIGISHNPTVRLESHNSGKVRSTKPYRPWSIIYSEKLPNRLDARKREVELKNNFEGRRKIFEQFS